MLLVPRSTTKARSAKNAILAPPKILLWTGGQETTFLGKTSREPKKRVDMDDQTDRMSFAAVCPKGHNPTLVFDRVILSAHLEDGTLRFYCLLCRAPWAPSEEVRLNLSAQLSSES